MPPFTLSQHTGSPDGDHYDLFLQVGETLKTWRFLKSVFELPQEIQKIDDHRLQYLTYEGPVSKDRGTVRIIDTGEYVTDLWSPHRVIIALQGHRFKGRIQLEQSKAGSQDEWTASDPTLAVRKLAAALLRHEPLETAPTSGLEELHTSLLSEEHSLLPLVDAYGKGAPVRWDQVRIDVSLRAKLSSQHTQWRHPWLEAALGHAGRLEEIAKQLEAARPPETAPHS